jgi:hypothetical protein
MCLSPGSSTVCAAKRIAFHRACRLFEGMQLEAWTRLSGLTGLTLRGVAASHRGTLLAVLPRATPLRSLVLDDDSVSGLAAAGVSIQNPGSEYTAGQLLAAGIWV